MAICSTFQTFCRSIALTGIRIVGVLERKEQGKRELVLRLFRTLTDSIRMNFKRPLTICGSYLLFCGFDLDIEESVSVWLFVRHRS